METWAAIVAPRVLPPTRLLPLYTWWTQE